MLNTQTRVNVKEGEIVAKSIGKDFIDMTQKERRDYLSSIKLLYKWDIDKGYYFVGDEKVLITECEYPKNNYTFLYSRKEAKLQSISEKKYAKLEFEKRVFDRVRQDVAIIRFKGKKFSATGYVKDNMFYFCAFGRYYKTKVYKKAGEWRGMNV